MVSRTGLKKTSKLQFKNEIENLFKPKIYTAFVKPKKVSNCKNYNKPR